ncbi:MAG: ABC transporter ATP-binding protein [Gammaproteobacteria bacterium]|jgi:putative spermidine/putrescine transport system ATP-binding protein/spermidine/putrescine transport system ATP-binding protein
MAGVELKGVTKSFGAVTAVEKSDIVFEEGSFTTLLGPSGCGKTTILRMVAGLETVTAGDIFIGDKRINDVPIHRRNLGLVFQNYALFPHKTIGENIAFGLKYRGVNKADAEIKVKEALEVVRLPGVEDRYPNQLSGGQQQRIALARAIVIEPDVLLLDEPLSALDANLREDMRVELTAIQDRIGVTTIFVTHDQSEALAMSDKIVVMSAGNVQQIGTPEDVYNKPASEFVAGFLGAANLLDARVDETDSDRITVETPHFGRVPVTRHNDVEFRQDGNAKLVVRAEKIRLVEPGSAPADEVCAAGTVEAVDYQGQMVRYFVRVDDLQLQVIAAIDERPRPKGAPVEVCIRPRDCVVLPAGA